MPEDRQKERPRILPPELQAKVLGENALRKANPGKSAGEFNQGRRHSLKKSVSENPKPKE